jgi:histidine triad (HIT) family protein
VSRRQQQANRDWGGPVTVFAVRGDRAVPRSTAAGRGSRFPRDPGVNLFLADGAAAFQEVFHTHLHVIPRNRGDGFRLHAKWRHPSRAELDSVAEKVRAAGNGQ